MKLPTASERALEWIEHHIKLNDLEPGDPLPGELEIARRARVGRSSVREALTTLKVLGLISTTRKGGIRLIRDSVLLELRYYFTQFYDSQERIDDAMEFRAAMEWGIGQLIFEHVSGKTIIALRRVVDKVETAHDKNIDLDAAEVQFHSLLTHAAGNRLATLFSHIYTPAFKTRKTPRKARTPTRKSIRRWVNDHRQIIEPLEKRNKRRFLTKLQQHTYSYMRFT
ncbi:FadR/GntR family transcriptional regulator [Verrucomicrobiota bacterium]